MMKEANRQSSIVNRHCRLPVPELVRERIASSGPITVADCMELALYHPECGYYARAPRRSGRDGDFYTSVDVGPLFGEMLAAELHDMWTLLGRERRIDLVEAGAGDGRLARDVLDAAQRSDTAFYDAIRMTLVERSTAARAAHRATLGPHADRLAASAENLPARVDGVTYANELLDALPAHALVMRDEGLREIYVDVEQGRLVEREGPLFSPRLAERLDRVGARPRPGWRTEVSLAAEDWVAAAARGIERGFLVVIDYGHEARELYSAAHAAGTLLTYRRHVASGARDGASWLATLGDADLTCHVDFTMVRAAAEREGMKQLALLDQTYFLLGLGILDHVQGAADVRRRLAAKTLLLPGGLGSTQKVAIFGKSVGTPALRCCSFRERMT
jgi:SAM-dependent MidA family methyltransferase